MLTAQETASLFEILRLFKEQGKTIILITHKLGEIMEITDQVTVMRAGRVVGAVATATTSKEELANMMVGRPIQSELPRAPFKPGAPVLAVNEPAADRQPASAPAGRHRLHAARRRDRRHRRRVGQRPERTDGNPVGHAPADFGQRRIPRQANCPSPKRHDADGLPKLFRHLGIGHVPEDRLRDGVIKDFSVMQNTVFGYQDRVKNRWGLFDFKAIAARCARPAQGLRRASDPTRTCALACSRAATSRRW